MIKHLIYVASRASIDERPRMWRDLRDAGWPISSSWIDEAGPEETKCFGDLWTRIAQEITASRGVVLYVRPDDFPLKGALIEVGMAMGQNKRIGIVAPGLVLEEPHLRPIGSWVRHPLVRFFPELETAKRWVLS
jgi:hypothetical protein